MPRYAIEFHDACMKRKVAEAMWNRNKAECIDLDEISSLKEQRALLRNLDTEGTSEVSEGMDVRKDS